MAIVYRTSGSWGPGIAEDLSAEQVDGNFHGLDQRVTELEDNPPEAVSIANVTSTGSTFTVHLSDGSAIGPLKLPVAAFNARGSWAAETLYTRNDVVTHDNAAYVVRLQHTSGISFEPNLVIGGEPVYQLLVSRPQGMFWRGIYATGTAYAFDDVIRVLGSGIWLVMIPHTTGTTESFDPEKAIDGAPVYEALMVEPAPYVPLGPVIESAVTAVDVSWAGTYVRVTYADGAVSVYVPAFGSAFPIGGEIHVRQATVLGQVTFLEDTGVTLNGVAGRSLATAGEGAVVTIKYLGSDTWDVWGDLAVA
jgi:hypothetical protein